MNLVLQYRNARKAVGQIRAGEWVPNSRAGDLPLTACRGDMELWIGNGAWFCEIESEQGQYFGLLWRHYVWWAAERRLKRQADKIWRRKTVVPQL